MAFEEFKREIVNPLSKRQAEQKLSAIGRNGTYVLVNANSRDEQIIQPLLQVLDQKGIGYDTADENENIELLVEQYDFHGLIIVYGQCKPQWAKEQVRAYRRIYLLKKRQRAPVCAVYIGPPDEKPALGIRLPNVALVSYRDIDSAESFLLGAQGRATAS